MSKGSGGLNTIFRNAEALSEAGCECDFYIPASIATAISRSEIERQITDWYGFSLPFQIFPCATRLEGYYDLAIASLWSTATFVEASDAKKKAYFVQDWEPSFYPVGEEHLNALSSYRLKLEKITIGKWLASKCSEMGRPLRIRSLVQISVYTGRWMAVLKNVQFVRSTSPRSHVGHRGC